jgi:hypothetical protein
MSSSSTDLIRAMFRDVIVPLAQSDPRCKLAFAPQPQNGSYFTSPERPVLSRDDMEAMGRSGELVALEAIWRAQGHDKLLALIPHLAAIAERLAAERGSEDKTSTPSELIYQMY